MAFFSEPPSWLKRLSFPWFRPLGDYRNRRWIVPIIASIILIIATISQPVFILLISGFNRGQSSQTQRIWMLGWLIANGVSVVSLVFSENVYPKFPTDLKFSSLWRSLVLSWKFLVLGFLVFSVIVFAIGGFVTVGKMLQAENYQPCST